MCFTVDKYFYKGFLTFYYTPDGIKYTMVDREDTEFYISLCKIFGDDKSVIEESINYFFSDKVYSLMCGQDFLESVKLGCFINDDGYIDSMYINGYKTNLGLICNGLSSGDFLVDEIIFNEILKNNEVIVNWVNK